MAALATQTVRGGHLLERRCRRPVRIAQPVTGDSNQRQGHIEPDQTLESGRSPDCRGDVAQGLSLGPSRALEDCRDALSTTNAHRDQGVAATNALQLVNGLGGDDGAGRTHGMTQGDARAIGVDQRGIEV